MTSEDSIYIHHSTTNLPRTMSTEIQLPYIRIEDVSDIQPIFITSHDIHPEDENKRIRVFCHQMLDDIIEETNLSNFDFHIYIYYKQRFRLQKRFPHREADLINASIEFWERMQIKYKELKCANIK